MSKKQRKGRGRQPVILSGKALLGVLVASRLHAAEPVDDPVARLTKPSSDVELGVGVVSPGSFKFSEYNGLQHQGAYPIVSFDLSGGGSYDSDSRERWSLLGRDLGLDTRELKADFREQGRFRFDLDYDQLRHNLSDTYQTPYLGTGSSTLHLPSGWLEPVVPQVNATGLNFRSLSPTTGLASAVTPSGQVAPPTAAQTATVNAILKSDVPAFHRYDLYTNRYRFGTGFTVNLTRSWQLSANFTQERKDGSQPIGAVSSAVQENSVILPERIDTVTNQFDAALRYASARGFLDFSYGGSLFHNNVRSITWDDPANPTRSASLSSAPSNQFHRLSVSGGYSFTPGTRLAVTGSYGRSTQNDSFLVDSSMPLGVPERSPDARVLSKVIDVKLTARPLRALNVVAGYKYDDEDNRTNVERFVFYDVNSAKGATSSSFNGPLGLAAGTLSSNVNIFNNRPHSRRLNQADLDLSYALAAGQTVAMGYQWQGLERHCQQTWIDCENAGKSNESTAKAEWRANWLETLDTRVAYSHADRTVDYNANAWLALVPMANVIPQAPTTGVTTSVYGYLTQTGLTGFGPLAGFPSTALTGNAAIYSPNNNIVPQSLYGSRDNVSELPGLRRFNAADRHRDQARASLDWQASDDFSLQFGGEYNRDNYEHSVYGLKTSRGWAANLEAAWRVNDDFELPVFYSHEDQRSNTAGDGYGSNTNAAFVGRAGNTLVSGSCFTTVSQKNLNAKIDPCLQWFTDMHERADTLGLTLSRNGFRGGRLDLSGDVLYSLARTDIGVSGGAYANNPFALAGAPVLAANVPAVFLIPGSRLPTVTSRTLEVRLRAQFALTRASVLNFLAAYERLRSTDFAYDGMQFGTGTELLPTNERPVSYSVKLFGISYVLRF